MIFCFSEERKKIILKFQMEKVQAALYQLHNNQEMVYILSATVLIIFIDCRNE